MILVDTSVWVDHLRAGDAALASALDADFVRMHAFVLGELACGNLPNPREVLDVLARLPAAPVATDAEVREFLEQRSLFGRGIGYVDAHLLAATALSPADRLWTRDRRLAALAAELRLAR